MSVSFIVDVFSRRSELFCVVDGCSRSPHSQARKMFDIYFGHVQRILLDTMGLRPLRPRDINLRRDTPQKMIVLQKFYLIFVPE
jgi:hypothetical protein